MRSLAYILLAIGMVLVGCAIYDEVRGSTTQPYQWLGRHRYYNRYIYRLRVLRSNNPELFRQFMSRHWVYAAFFGVGGVIVLLAAQNAERAERGE
jgi:hypothetical protein